MLVIASRAKQSQLFVDAVRRMRDPSNFHRELRQRIGDASRRYTEDPPNYARRIVDHSLGNYRFRVVDYGVVFDLESDKTEV